MFLRYILSRPENDMLKNFFKAQCSSPSKNDWCVTVQDDIDDLEIDETFDSIGKMSKDKLSKILKEANRKKAFEDLLDKQGTYSKGSNLVYGKLQMREYLQSENLNINQKKLIFKIRTRMFFVKANYKHGKYKTFILEFFYSLYPPKQK